MGIPIHNRTNRRRFIGGTAGAAASVTMLDAALAAPEHRRAPAFIRSQDAVELEVWGFNAERLEFAENAATLPAFTDAHPNVTVNFRLFPFAEMHDRLLAALVGGRGAPDISEVEIAEFSSFLKGDRIPFVPLGERIGAELDNLYQPAAVDPWSFGGEIYGLGNELNAVVLTYRQDILDELGVETPFETWDQVIEAGMLIAEDGETKTFAVHDIHFGDWFQAAQFAGGGLFDADGTYTGDGELSVEALQFVHDLVHVHEIAGIAPADAQNTFQGPAYYAAFAAGLFTMLWGPPWHIGRLPTDVPDQAGLWAAQAIPTGLGENRPTANFGGTGQCITEQSEHVDIAWDLIAAGNLTVEGQLFDFQARTVYPNYIPAYDDPILQEPNAYFSGARLGELYASVAADLPPFYQSPFFADTNAEMVRTVITPVMTDDADPAATLQELGALVDEMQE